MNNKGRAGSSQGGDNQEDAHPLSAMEQSQPLVTDAAPQQSLQNINQRRTRKLKKENLSDLFQDFTLLDFKSALFILMDHVGVNNYFNLIKHSHCVLKQELMDIFYTVSNDRVDKVLIEVLGTMKDYEKLEDLGTCYHVFKVTEEREFNQIHGVWKVLYSVCEELPRLTLDCLKETVPSNFRDQIVDAEDWFCWAFQKLYSKMDLSMLEDVFHNYPTCLDILKSYKVKLKSYDVRPSTPYSHCGIAVILNYVEFEKLEVRQGSDKDVDSLKKLWDTFGFKTKVHTNLGWSETFQVLRYYAESDHTDYDVFVCCILSHGMPNCIYSSDDQLIPIPELIKVIVNHSSIRLANIPKLFFIQACQGSYLQQGVGNPVFRPQNSNASLVKTYNSCQPPIKSDVLEAVSTIDGYVSFRSVEYGSWFINALCKSMMEYGDKVSILDVMTEVNNQVRKNSADFGPGGPRNAQQIISCSSTLGKTLILKKRIQLRCLPINGILV